MAQVEVKWVFPGAKEAADAIKKIEDSVKKTGDQAKESTDKMTGAFDANLKSLAAWAAGFATVAAATAFLKDAVAAAVESQKETALLARQVEAAGVSWEKYGQRIDDVIQASSAYGRVQDEEVSAALREMVTMTNDVRASTENLNLVIDLAYAKNISLSQAAQIVGKAMEGDIRAVAQFLPELKRLDETLGANATTAQKVEAVFGTLNERFRGAAETMPEFEKQTKDLSLAWEGFKETVGTKVLPVLTVLLNGIKKGTDDLSAQVDAVKNATGFWDTLAKTFFLIFDITPEISKNFENNAKALFGLNDAINESAKATETMNFVLGQTNKEVDELPGNLKKAAEEAKRAAEQLKAWQAYMDNAIEEYKKSQEEIGKKILEVAQKGWGDYQEYLGRRILQDARDTADELGRIEERKGKKIQDEAKEAFDKFEREQKEAAEEFERTFQAVSHDVGRAISDSFVYGDSIKDNIKALGKHLLSELIASMIAWEVNAIATATGIKAQMQAIFSVPIPQPVVPTIVGGPGGAAATGASAASGAAGAGAAGSGGLIAAHGGTGATAAAMDAGAVGGTAAGAGAVGPTTAAGAAAVTAAAFIAWDPSLIMGGQQGTPEERMANFVFGQIVQRRRSPADALALIQRQFPNPNVDWDLVRRITAMHIATQAGEVRVPFTLETIDPTLYGLERGGIATEEGIFKLAERGKKEAVIPLENPQAMQHLAAAGLGGNVNINISGTNFWDEITYHKFIRRIKRDLGNRRFA